MPRSSRYLHIRLRMERDKLVNWAVLANLSEDERTLNSGLRLNKQKVNSNLQEIRAVLLELVKFSVRYDVDRVNSDSDDGTMVDTSDIVSPRNNSTLQQKAITFISEMRKFPKRLQWVTFNKKQFEMLLAKLTLLNGGMIDFFEKNSQEKHLQMQEGTFMAILQANDKLEDLLDLMASLNATKTYMVAPVLDQRLLQLARFKAFNVAIEEAKPGFDEDSIKSRLGDAPTRSKWILLDSHRVLLRQNKGLEDQPARAYGSYENIPVWVEWKYCMCIFLQDLNRSRSIDANRGLKTNPLAKDLRLTSWKTVSTSWQRCCGRRRSRTSSGFPAALDTSIKQKTTGLASYFKQR